MSKATYYAREWKLVADAAALWKGLALYESGGNLRWHRSHMIPAGAVSGRVATPYNQAVKSYLARIRRLHGDAIDPLTGMKWSPSGVLHHLAKVEFGFDDRERRDNYRRERGLLPEDK